MRKSIALILSAGLLATLSACASGGSTGGDCTPLVSPGASSETIAIKGDGSNATVSFGVPLNAPKTQRSVLVDGKGRAAQPNDVVETDATVYDGSTGAPAGAPGHIFFTLGSANPVGVNDALVCARPGDRIAAAIPNEALADPTAAAPPASGGPTAAVIFDVTHVYPGKATGADQPAQPGFPSVATTDIGRPGLTIPSGPIPTKLSYTALKKGDGAKVAAGDVLVVQYTGVDWASKTVFDSTWEKGTAAQVAVSPTQSQGDGGIVPGLVTALTGQTVGSQVIAVIPPDQGFGDAGNGGTVAAGATLVYVVDILGIISAK